MRINNIEMDIVVPMPGTQMRSDEQCCTEILSPSGEWFGGPDAHFTMPRWGTGDAFAFLTRNGDFIGKVKSVELGTPISTQCTLHCSGEWHGSEGSLLGGLFAFGRFYAELADDTLVETSTCSEPVPYGLYKAAKAAAYEEGDLPAGQERGEAVQRRMKRYFEQHPPVPTKGNGWQLVFT